MKRPLRTAADALRRSRSFAVGLLIGTGLVSPVFAAPEITTDEWTTLLLLGSIALLGIGLLVKARHGRATTTSANPQPAPQQHASGIAQYRPQTYH